MGRKNKSINSFACPVEEDNNDISGFSDEPIIKGKCLSSFSFYDTKPYDSDNNEEVITSQINKLNTIISAKLGVIIDNYPNDDSRKVT